MLRRLSGAPFLALVVAAYVVASLWPFRPWRWNPPRFITNGVEAAAEGGVVFRSAGILPTRAMPPSLQEAIKADRLLLRLDVRTAGADQEGPARLVTISPDPYFRDLTLGQEGADLVLRVRADGAASEKSMPDAAVFEVPGVFARPEWVDIAVEIAPSHLRLWTNGALRLDEPVAEHPLASWDPAFPVSIGNEATHDRPWLGAIRSVTAQTPAGPVDLLPAGLVPEAPRRYWYPGRAYELVPFGARHPTDAILNLLGYIPLGVVLGRAVGHRLTRWRVLAALAASIAVFSATMEFLQFAVLPRYPSTTDLVLNTLGGALGLLLARYGRLRAPDADPSPRR